MTLQELLTLAGKWIAMEIYDRDLQPRRRIAVVGDSAADCIRKLVAKGLDPKRYEFRPMKRPIS